MEQLILKLATDVTLITKANIANTHFDLILTIQLRKSISGYLFISLEKLAVECWNMKGSAQVNIPQTGSRSLEFFPPLVSYRQAMINILHLN